MPAGKKPRRGSLGNEHAAVTAPLGENERLIELVVYVEVSCAAESPPAAGTSLDRLLVRAQLADEVKVAAPLAQPERDTAVAAASAAMPRASETVPTRCVQTTLLTKRITLSCPLLESLCGEQTAHQVTLHLPPSIAAAATAAVEAPAQTTPGQRGQKTGVKAEKEPSQGPVTGPPQGRQERIRSARGARREVSLVCGECIAQTAVSLLDVLVEQRSCRYELTPAAPPHGLVRCWVELRCSDMPLLQPRRLLEAFRPVCLTLESVDALPVPRQSHTEAGDTAAELELEVGLLGTVRRARFRQPENGAQGCVWRTMLLLRDASPLTVYQHLLLDRVTLTLYSVAAERALIGTGAFSLRAYLTHGQTSFRELVQLLPRRATVTSTESCLTAGCTASVAVDLFVPFPLLRHVDASGAAATHRFLTRAVLILPYSSDGEATPWVARALACLIGELRQLPVARAGEAEVRLYVEPDPPPPPAFGVAEDTDATEGGAGASAGVGDTGAGTSGAPADGDVSDSAGDEDEDDDGSEQDDEAAKEEERGKHRPRATRGLRQRSKPPQQQLGAGARRSVPGPAPTSPSPPPDQSADPLAPFERPFSVVSPVGISGFEVIDAAQRIVCLEGPVADLHHVLQAVADAAGHPATLRLLFNAELFVPRRQYVTFPPLITPPPPPPAAGQAEEGGGTAGQASRGGACRSRSRPSSATRTPPPLASGGKEPRSADGGVAGTGVAHASRTSPRARPEQQSGTGTSAAPCGAVSPQAGGEAGAGAAEEDVSKGDAEASGTGGRLHRVRLRETLASIVLQPRYLLRRALAEACLRCLQQLHTLQRCTTMREAIDRDCFPSAADIISVERSFGQTLELVDLYGEAAPSRPAAAASRAPQAELSTAAAPPPTVAADVQADKLRPEDVGCLASFVGYLYTAKPRRVPRCVREHYPVTAWMQTLEGGLVLCAFAEAMPGRTIRYHVEGQVTRCQTTLLLYVLAARSLAVSQTSSTNAEFEARLRQRARAVRDEVTLRLTQQLPLHTSSQRSVAATAAHATQPGSTSVTPVKIAVTTGGDGDDSEDDNARANWPRAPVCGDARAGQNAPRVARDGQGALAASGDPSGVHGTKTSRMLAAMHKQKQREAREAEYALWWSLYNQRAPRNVDHTRDVTRHVFHF